VILQIATDREIVFKFFAVFSRFECAMKRAGFLHGDRFGNAKPDWTRFSASFGGHLSTSSDPVFQAARANLLGAPPKRQVVTDDGGIGWADNLRRSNDTDDEHLLRLVQTVRNNLFHGGKYPYPAGPVEDVARNRGLLVDSLAVLDQCIVMSSDLEHWFADAA
jgi:hypothetical protein